MRKAQVEALLREWRSDRPGFRKSNRVLESGAKYGECFAPWQETEIFIPLQEKRVNKFLFVLPRGADKTAGAGAWYPLETLVLEENQEIIVVGVDTDVGVLNLREINEFCRRNPFLDSLVKRNKNEITTKSGRITVLSSDAASSFGVKPTLVICDEFSNWWKEGHEELFWSLFSSIAKRPGARIVILSNAGAGYSKLYFQLREKIEADPLGWHVWAPTDLRIPWMSEEELESQRRTLPSAQWTRLFANIDVPQTGNFISVHELEACIDRGLQPAERGKADTVYFMGCDYGRKHDRTAIVVVHAEGESIVIDDVWHAKGSRESPVSFSTVENQLLSFAGRFSIGTCFADPFQLLNTMEKLRDRIPMSEFVFSQQSWNQLAQNLYHAIHHKKLRIYRAPVIINEILQLQMIETPSGLKFDHQKNNYSYSDIATSLALAITACLQTGGFELTPAPVFWSETAKLYGMNESSVKSDISYVGSVPGGLSETELARHSKSWRRPDKDPLRQEMEDLGLI